MELTNITNIVPPVAKMHVSASTGAIRRQSNRLSYAKANQRWWIEVLFDSEIDVMIFEKSIKGSTIRLVEFDGRFYIEDPRLPDTAPMSAPFQYAEVELPKLNAAICLMCSEYLPARFHCAVQLFPDGHGQSIVAHDLNLHGSASDSKVVEFLQGPETNLQAIIDLSAMNEGVQEALFYLGSAGNPWANLYKLCEIIEEACGGKEQVLDRGWCSRAEWERFKRTANHQEAIGMFSRHARMKADPPPDPMPLGDARSLARRLLDGWIQELLGPTRS